MKKINKMENNINDDFDSISSDKSDSDPIVSLIASLIRMNLKSILKNLTVNLTMILTMNLIISFLMNLKIKTLFS